MSTFVITSLQILIAKLELRDITMKQIQNTILSDGETSYL